MHHPKVRAIYPSILAVAAVAGAFAPAACSSSPSDVDVRAAEQAAALPALKSFRSWLDHAGRTLSAQEEKTLAEDGHLLGVVPESELPVQHQDGLVEVSAGTMDRLEALRAAGASQEDYFRARVREGLFNPHDPVDVELARKYFGATSVTSGVTPMASGSPGDASSDGSGSSSGTRPDAGMERCTITCTGTVTNQVDPNNGDLVCQTSNIGTSIKPLSRKALVELGVSCQADSACGKNWTVQGGQLGVSGDVDIHTVSADPGYQYDKNSVELSVNSNGSYGVTWPAACMRTGTPQAFKFELDVKAGSAGTTGSGESSRGWKVGGTAHLGGSGKMLGGSAEGYEASAVGDGNAALDANVTAANSYTSKQDFNSGGLASHDSHTYLAPGPFVADFYQRTDPMTGAVTACAAMNARIDMSVGGTISCDQKANNYGSNDHTKGQGGGYVNARVSVPKSGKTGWYCSSDAYAGCDVYFNAQ